MVRRLPSLTAIIWYLEVIFGRKSLSKKVIKESSNNFSVLGIIIHGDDFMFDNPMDWVYCAVVASIGILGNAANLVFLSQKQRDRHRGGWPTQYTIVPGILIGVVARSSLEIISIYAINLMTINQGIFNGGEWIGIGAVLFLGLFSCVVKRGQKGPTGNSSNCSDR